MNTAPRSTFVTVVAWIFIILSGFGTLIGIMQNIMIQTLFNGPEMQQAMQAAASPDVPAFAQFMANHVPLFFAMFLIVSAAMLTSSIGLLKRKNWARVIFVGLMVLGIVWSLGGLILQFTMFSSLQHDFADVPGAPDMKPFFIAMVVFNLLIALGFSGLFAWIAKRLTSPAIVREFKP